MTKIMTINKLLEELECAVTAVTGVANGMAEVEVDGGTLDEISRKCKWYIGVK